MALHFVFGGSGFGKSYHVYNEIMKKSVTNPEKTYIVIVPEQFTMQTQKDMVMLSKDKGIMNIDVLSFVRLAYRVLEKTSALSRPILEDEGKGMVIRKILREHAGEWKTFGNNINRSGFVEEIKSIVTEFVQYRVDEAAIDDMKQGIKGHGILGDKLEDLKCVYRYYTNYMEDRYLASEELLVLLARYVTESDFIKNSVMCIDGFTGFTPVQYVLLKELMKVCEDIYITVTIDKEADPFGKTSVDDLFYMSKQFVKKCMKTAMDTGTEVSEPIWVQNADGRGYRFEDNEELSLLEKTVFRGNITNTIEKNERIQVYEAANPYEESRYVVWQIRKLVREKKLRYRDIAVITGDVTLYQRTLGQELEGCGIPYFADNNRRVPDNVFIGMIMDLLTVVNSGYEYKSVMKLLRNGFVRDYLFFDEESVDEIDNYLLATGIRGIEAWKKEWKEVKRSKTDIELVNNCRNHFVEVFIKLHDDLKNAKTVLDYCKALYGFMAQYDMGDILMDIADEYENKNDRVLQKEFSQIYRIVIKLMDQMVLLMGEEEVTLKEYMELMKTGFNEASVGVIPPGTDTIIIGDLARTRLKDIKVLFFVGVNDGNIPKAVKSGGFLSDVEREILYENDAFLAPTFRERIFNERFYVYLALTRPSDNLYISYCAKDTNANKLEPSQVLTEINKLYKNGYETLCLYTEWGQSEALENDNGYKWWINGLRKYAARVLDEEETEKWLPLHKEYAADKRKKDIIDSAFFVARSSELTREVAKKLYTDNIDVSVSRLELYAACAYAHFLRYGLRLDDRAVYEIAIPDVGIIFHAIIEEFSFRLKHTNKKWRDADDRIIRQWTEEITDRICDEYGNGVILKDARSEYMKERIKRIAAATISSLTRQMAKGKFEARSYEIRFSDIKSSNAFSLALENGGTMHLQGRIDRLDVCEEDDRLMYKIIDYKSGNKSFDLNELYHGLSMQLIVYLQAGKEISGESYPDKLIIPAGAFYFHIDDPVVDLSNDVEGDIEKAYRMKGPVNRDNNIPCYIDEGLGDIKNGVAAGVKSDVINIKTNKNGSYAAGSSQISGEQFEYMVKHTYDKMTGFGNEIVNGNVEAKPYKMDKESPCDCCSYKSVCGFDSRLEGYGYRELEKKCDEEIWEEWRELYGKKD